MRTYLLSGALPRDNVQVSMHARAFTLVIRESVDSPCMDGTDTPYCVIKTSKNQLSTNLSQSISFRFILFRCSATTRLSNSLKSIAEVLNWKVAKLPNCSFSYFQMDYLKLLAHNGCIS